MTTTQTNDHTKPISVSSGWPHLTDDHRTHETHTKYVVGHLLAIDHNRNETQGMYVDGDLLPTSHRPNETPFLDAGGDTSQDGGRGTWPT